jgi:hypothetical protein
MRECVGRAGKCAVGNATRGRSVRQAKRKKGAAGNMRRHGLAGLLRAWSVACQKADPYCVAGVARDCVVVGAMMPGVV